MFCDRLRACRIARNYTLQEMADAVDISLRTYQKYEGGSTFPDFSHLVKLADFLDISTDFLLERDDYLQSLGVSVDVSLKCPPRRPKSQNSRHSLRTQSAGNSAD